MALSPDYGHACTLSQLLENLQRQRATQNITIPSHLLHKDVINCRSSEGHTGLLTAINYGFGHSVIMQILNSDHIDVNLSDLRGNTPLICAIQRQMWDIVKILVINSNIDVNVKAVTGRTALLMVLVSLRGSLGKSSRTAFQKIKIVDIEHKKAIRNLISEYGIEEPHAMEGENTKQTFSVEEVIAKQSDIVAKLLNNKSVDVNICDNNGNSALMYLMLCLPLQQVQIASTSKPYHSDDERITKTIVKLLQKLIIRDDLNINTQDKTGLTALMYAVQNPYEQVVKLLLDCPKNNFALQNAKGQTVLILSVITAIKIPKMFSLYPGEDWLTVYNPLQALIKKSDIKIHMVDNSGRSALSIAVSSQNTDVACSLLGHPEFDVNETIVGNMAMEKIDPLQLILQNSNIQFTFNDRLGHNIFNLQQHIGVQSGSTLLAQLVKHQSFIKDISTLPLLYCESTVFHALVHGNHFEPLQTIIKQSKNGVKPKLNLDVKDCNGTDIWEAILQCCLSGHYNISDNGACKQCLKETQTTKNALIKHPACIEIMQTKKSQLLLTFKDFLTTMDNVNKTFEVYKKGTLLHRAVDKGLDEVVEILLNTESINPNIKDETLQTPLKLTIGHLKRLTDVEIKYQKDVIQIASFSRITELLVNHKATDINIEDHPHSRKLLMKICYINGNLNVPLYSESIPKYYMHPHKYIHPVHHLLKSPAIDLNVRDSKGIPAIFYAAFQWNLEVFEALVKNPSCDVNICISDAETDSESTESQSVTLLRNFMKLGAIKKKVTNKPSSEEILIYQMTDQEREILSPAYFITILLSSPYLATDVNEEITLDGLTPLHILALVNKFELVDILTKNTNLPVLDVFRTDNDGFSVWEAFCIVHRKYSAAQPKTKDEEIRSNKTKHSIEEALMKLASQEKIEINKLDHKTNTMLHYVCEYGVNNVVSKFLELEKTDINIKDGKGFTPLMKAIGKLNRDVIERYVNHHQCNLTLKNNYGQTICSIADVLAKTKDLDPALHSLVNTVFESQTGTVVETKLLSDLSIIQQITFLKKSFEKDSKLSKRDKDIFLYQIEGLEQDYLVSQGRSMSENNGMTDTQRKKLIRKRRYLCSELVPGDLFDYLIQEEVLTEDKVEEIKLEGTRLKTSQKLISELPFCGKNAYTCFINALRESAQGYIADELENFDPDDEDAGSQCTDIKEFGTQQFLENNMLFPGSSPSVVLPVHVQRDGTPFIAIPVMNLGNNN